MRWRWWMLTTTLMLCSGISLHPRVFSQLVGLWRREAFYQSMPTSWWRQRLDGWELGDRYSGPIRTPRGAANVKESAWESSPIIGIWFSTPTVSLQEGDPASLPVLVELLNDPDPKIQALALTGIREIGPYATNAVLPLLTYCQRLRAKMQAPGGWHREIDAYLMAFDVLKQIDPDAARSERACYDVGEIPPARGVP